MRALVCSARGGEANTHGAHGADQVHFPAVQEDQYEWVLECRQNGFVVTRPTIRFRA